MGHIGDKYFQAINRPANDNTIKQQQTGNTQKHKKSP